MLCSQDRWLLTKNKCGGRGVEQPGWGCVPSSLSPCTPGEVWDSCAAPQGMQVALAKQGICHHLMLVLQARYICCRAFFFFNSLFSPVFVASSDPILSPVQLCKVEVSPSPRMVPSPLALDPLPGLPSAWPSWPGS